LSQNFSAKAAGCNPYQNDYRQYDEYLLSNRFFFHTGDVIVTCFIICCSEHRCERCEFHAGFLD
jgi:hypothetical protein